MVSSVCFNLEPSHAWDDEPSTDRIDRSTATTIRLRNSHHARDKRRAEKKLAEQAGPICCKCTTGCTAKTCKCLRLGKNCGSDCKCTKHGRSCKNREPDANAGAPTTSTPSPTGIGHDTENVPNQTEQAEAEQHDTHGCNMTFSDYDDAASNPPSDHNCHSDEMDVDDADAAVEESDAAPDDSALPPGVQRSTVDPAALRFSLRRSARPNRGANIDFNVLNFGGRLGRAKRPRK